MAYLVIIVLEHGDAPALITLTSCITDGTACMVTCLLYVDIRQVCFCWRFFFGIVATGVLSVTALGSVVRSHLNLFGHGKGSSLGSCDVDDNDCMILTVFDAASLVSGKCQTQQLELCVLLIPDVNVPEPRM